MTIIEAVQIVESDPHFHILTEFLDSLRREKHLTQAEHQATTEAINAAMGLAYLKGWLASKQMKVSPSIIDHINHSRKRHLCN